jgi:hypothetical protein
MPRYHLCCWYSLPAWVKTLIIYQVGPLQCCNLDQPASEFSLNLTSYQSGQNKESVGIIISRSNNNKKYIESNRIIVDGFQLTLQLIIGEPGESVGITGMRKWYIKLYCLRYCSLDRKLQFQQKRENRC